MKVKFKKLSPLAKTPARAHKTDAAYDLVATSATVEDNGCLCYGTGLAFEIPEGYAGFVFSRSSVSNYSLSQANCVGVIDSGYRGEVTVKFKPTLEFMDKDDPDHTAYRIPRRYNVGDRIAQLIVMPVPEIEFEEATDLGESERGVGGYGSTGK